MVVAVAPFAPLAADASLGVHSSRLSMLPSSPVSLLVPVMLTRSGADVPGVLDWVAWRGTCAVVMSSEPVCAGRF